MIGGLRSSVRFVWSGNGFQGRSGVPKLGMAEVAGEVLADAPQMSPRGSSQEPASPVRQPGQGNPSVSVEAISLDEAGFDESVHHPRQPARGEHDPLGELGHPQGMARSTSQPEEHVVGPESETVLLSELGIQLRNHLMMGVKERLPGPKLRLGESFHHERSVAMEHLRIQVS
jgi:hypothetical protein